MTVKEATRLLGAAIQQDERYIEFAKATLANDKDEALQAKIGEFNLVRMSLDKALSEEEQDNDKVQALNEQLRNLYTEIMNGESMTKYNEAKAKLDNLMNEVNSIIAQCVDGADPETVEPQTQCTGSCSTCGGCH